MNTIFFKTKVKIGNYEKDAIVGLKCDSKGVPFDQFWKSRFLDKDIEKTNIKRQVIDIKKAIEKKRR